MPKSLKFNTSSYIYALGDEADKIFILQSGKAALVYNDIETGKVVRDLLQPGEFFGVKSALGRYPREENAMALTSVMVTAFSIPEFEALALSNTRIIMKMLKVFSNQLRRVHTQVSRLTESVGIKSEEGLFSVGERYFKLKRHSHAKYVFSSYLAYYPAGKYASQARKNLQLVEVALALAAGDKSSGTNKTGA